MIRPATCALDDVELRAQLEETLEIERRCCPFFTLEYQADQRTLEISIDDDRHRDALTTLVLALAPGEASPQPTEALATGCGCCA